MEPFEIMISESQERMLCVVEPAQLDEVLAVCRALGDATRRRSARSPTRERLRVFDGGELVGDMPVSALVDECPLYDLEPAGAGRPARSALRSRARGSRRDADAGRDPARAARLRERREPPMGVRAVRLPGRQPHGAPARSRRTRRCCGSRSRDVDTDRALAVSIDGNGRRVACDPYVGAAEAVCECAANLACVGAEPLGLTNCLNFGNPEKPHVAWQLTRAVEGMAAACRALEVPVVGGNVSLYNEGPDGPDLPDAGRRHGRRAARRRRAGASAFHAPPARSRTWSR